MQTNIAGDAPDATWEARVRAFGIDPDRHVLGHWRAVSALGVEDLTRMLDAPVLADQEPCVFATAAEARRAHPHALHEAVVQHISGMARITNPEVIEEIDRRFGEIPLQVLATPGPIVVTEKKPLIINSTHSATEFTTVTIEPGGYIEITVNCLFSCARLEKRSASGAEPDPPAAPADIVVRGVEGTDGTDGPAGEPGVKGDDGPGASCICSRVHSNGVPGARGSHAGNGDPGRVGTKPPAGPKVILRIGELASTVSLLNVGGRGGNGGNGGNGGDGGKGGNGGVDTRCGAVLADGGNGGNGGNGGDGGDGGSASEGGAGGDVIVYYTKAVGDSTILVSNLKSPAGKPGAGGKTGAGGRGGASGGRSATPGGPGNAGLKPGANGASGASGAEGTVKINPKTL